MALAEAPTPVAAGMIHAPASELRRALAPVEHATGDEDQRPVLSAVLLSAHNGQLYAVAADNYRIAEAHIECQGNPDFLGESTTLIAASDRPAIAAWLKACGKHAEVDIALDGNLLTLGYGKRQLVVTLMDGQFPKYRSVMDVDTLPPVVFAVHPAFLADAGKAMAPENLVQIRAASATSPIHFRRDGYREIVMPVREAE